MTDTRPVLLITTLAAAAAIAATRLVGVLNVLTFDLVARIPYEGAMHCLRCKPVIEFAVMTAAALAVPYWQHKALAKRSLRINYIALAVLVLLAACPIRVDIHHVIMADEETELYESPSANDDEAKGNEE